MANKALDIVLRLTANTAKAEARIQKFARKARESFIRGGAIAAPLILAAREAAKLEESIADVAKVANVDFGSQQFAALSASALKVGEHLAVSADQAGELMAALAQGGVPVDRLDALAVKAGEVGVAFGVSAGEAGAGFMMIQNAMGATEAETMRIMDAMNALTNKFGGSAAELLTFMAAGAASVAGTMKVAGTDMQAFGNAFQVVGITASEAATSMSRFQKMVITNAQASRMFNAAGGGADGILAILRAAKRSGDATKYLLDLGLGAYATQFGQMATNLDTEKGLEAQLRMIRTANIEGSAHEEFLNRSKTTMFNFNQGVVQLKNSVISLGALLLPLANEFMNSVKPIIQATTEWIQNNKELSLRILKVIAAIAAFNLVVGGVSAGVSGFLKVGQAVGSVIGATKKAIKWMKSLRQAMIIAKTAKTFAGGSSMMVKSLRTLRAAAVLSSKVIGRAMLFMLGPWGLLIAAVAGAVYLIIKHWDKIKVFFSNLWEGVKEKFAQFIAWVSDLFMKYTPAGLIFTHWEKITEFFSGLWDKVKEKFLAFIDFFVKKWKWLKEKVIDPIKNIFSGNRLQGQFNSEITHAIREPRLQPVPVANNRVVNTTHFAANITLNGQASQADADMVTAQLRREFHRLQAEQEHQRERRRVG